MNGSKHRPSNMNDVCRLCLAEDEITSPIFPGEDSTESDIPLSFRIMACVSVEVSISDGLPAVICERCLHHVNSWHEFKQICDLSQATLKEWQNSNKENATFVEKDIIIKQEPVDPEQELEVIEDVGNQFMVEDIKQEVDFYDGDRQDCASVEAINEDSCDDPLSMSVACTSNSFTGDDDVEFVPQTGDVCHLRISDIKTECNDVIPLSNIPAEPTEGRLLRSVLQGKSKMNMYTRKVSTTLDETLDGYQSVKPYNCSICNKSFAYNYLLKRHEKTHTGDRNVCAYCQKGFSSHASLVQHVMLYNGTTSTPYSCEHCKVEFACRTLYLSHVEGPDGSCCTALAVRDHSQDVEELQDDSGQCDVCHEKFSSQMLLRLHMRKEHLRYSCHKCDKSYTNGVALSNHLRSHSLRGTRHFCGTCTRTFPTLELLKKHERTHMKEKAAMAVIPAEVIPEQSENVLEADLGTPLVETEEFLDRPIKEEPPDSPEVVQDMPQQFLEIEHTQQSHICHLCNENFPTVASLRFHLKGVHLHYQCHRCPKVYSSGVALSNHLRSHSLTSFKKHKCLVCLKTFSSVDVLTKHKKIHSAPAAISFAPRKSGNSYLPVEDIPNDLDVSTLEDNVIDSESLAKRTCNLCNLVTPSPSALERHMTCHSKDKLYRCSICHVSMSYASSLQKHYRLIHSTHVELKSIQKDGVLAANKVRVSAIINAQKQSSLRPEGSTRSGRRTVFNKTFKMTAQLQQAKLPAPYECNICHRSFAYRSFLLKHSRVHSNSRLTVSCPICLKTFPDLKTLNNHKGVHTRFQHYACNICGKSFNGLNAWQKHQRMHQKGFIYSCKLCGKKFLSKADLHEHKKMHIKLKIYTCAVCKNSYHSSSALGKHKRRHRHWYASPEASEVSEIEVVQQATSVSKKHVTKTSLVRPTNPAAIVSRQGKAPGSRNVTHFPSGKRRPFCGICNKTFSRVTTLRNHKRMHEKKDIKPIITLETDYQTPVVTEDNTCLTCNRSFPDPTSLARHKGWHTRRCYNSSSSPTVPTSSEKSPLSPCFVKLEPSTPNAYQCSICSKTFTASSGLESHVKSHSEGNKSGTSIEKTKIVEGDKSDVLPSSRRLACKICKKPFDSKKALITHIGWHSRDSHVNKSSFHTYKPKSTYSFGVVDRFTCNVCHKIFSSAAILSKHKKLHTRKLMSSIKVKPGSTSESTKDGTYYSCPVCLRAFKLQKYLQLHMRLHTGEKRFKCNLCPQAYHRSGSLWKHRRTHHAVKLFSCHVCHKRFGLKNQLTKHVETHQADTSFANNETVFACSMCDRTFPTLSKYKQHEKSHNV